MGRRHVNTEAKTRLRRLQDQAQGCGTRSWRRRRGARIPPWSLWRELGLFDVRTGTSDLRGDGGHPCSEEPFPIGSPPNTSTGGLDTGVRCERLCPPAPLCSQNWVMQGGGRSVREKQAPCSPASLGNLGATNLGTSELQGLPSSCEP